MQYDHMAVVRSGALARVTLNRPEVFNALSMHLLGELHHYFGTLTARSPERVVILEGAGRVFCAGLDLKEMKATGASRGVIDMVEQQHAIRDVMLAMRRCPQPVVSVQQGAASGGGLALALASDVRLATPELRMNAAFVRLGLSGCDVGVSYFLPRMVGASVAAEFLLTGRFMDAARALSLGLVSRVGTLEAMREEALAPASEVKVQAGVACTV